MFEHARQKLIPLEEFLQRLFRSYLYATGLMVLSVIPGMLGYHFVEGLGWREALIDACSILGQIDAPYLPQSDAGRLFSAVFGVFAQSVFLIALAIIFTPIIHRLLHRMHADAE